MAVISRVLHPDDKPDEKAREEVAEAAGKAIVYDEDSPELTEEQYAELKKIAGRRKNMSAS